MKTWNPSPGRGAGSPRGRTGPTLLAGLLLTAGCTMSPRPQAPAYDPVAEPLEVSTYMLSPNDEIRISVHGYPELERTFRIPPNGTLFYPFVGEIQVHGMGIAELRRTLAEGLETAEAQRISTGNEIQVSIYRHPELDVTTIVPSSGSVNLPLAGDVMLAGLTVEQANAAIASKLSKYLIGPSVRTTVRDPSSPGPISDPQVVVEVLGFGGQKIAVLGEVESPGIYLLDGPASLTTVLALAGGPTPAAKLENVAIVRPGSATTEPRGILADLEMALEQADTSQNVSIQRGDVIYVPTKTIADTARFFEYLYAIVRPIVTVETGIWLGQNIDEGPRRNVGNTIIFQ